MGASRRNYKSCNPRRVKTPGTTFALTTCARLTSSLDYLPLHFAARLNLWAQRNENEGFSATLDRSKGDFPF